MQTGPPAWLRQWTVAKIVGISLTLVRRSNKINRVLSAFAVLIVFAGTSIGTAQEDSRQKFFNFFQPIVGDWQITSPEGKTSDYTLTFSKSKACFISDNADATHIHGWNPEKTVSVVSFFSNGSKAVGDLSFEGKKTLVGNVTIRRADGTKEEFKLTWQVVSNDRQELTIDDQKSTVTRTSLTRSRPE